MEEIKNFLKEYNDSESPTFEFNINPKIIGNYTLNREDVSAQVLDWCLHHLEDRKCPYNLAVAIAKETAQQIENSISEQQFKENSEGGKLLNSLALYNEAIKSVLPSVCKYFSEEINEPDFSNFKAPFTASVFAVKNKRRKMEDRHVIHHDLNLFLGIEDAPSHSYYAVFDGHSGVDAASYASAYLHINIANHPAFLSDTAAAISEAYKITDENFTKKCQEENLKSGTTAVCALFREKTVYLSWVGDSQAVLVKKGKPVIVTSPHKPDREDERKRIESLGGTITFMGTPRVNGMLAVTRAIGDADHKPFISSEPEITAMSLEGSEDFLILACDGLWDGMSPEDVVAALYYNLLESNLDEPLDTIAAKLVHQSKLQGSEDNITAVVVFLRDLKDIKEDAGKYAPNLSKANLKMNFFELNGEENQFGNMASGVSLSKPTVLELNSSSVTKLKNTADVLNAAGLRDPSLSYSFSENSECLSYQSSKVESISYGHSVAPETTALSELPTPPIDDFLASQQFQEVCSAALSQELSTVSQSRLSQCDNLVSPVKSQSISSEDSDTEDSQISKSSEQLGKDSEVISPDEAIDIAATVVSDTIESAVKCISEKEDDGSKIHVSSQLNPFAEPFVMKSFISNEPLSDSIDIVPPLQEPSKVVPVDTEINLNSELPELRSSSDETDRTVNTNTSFTDQLPHTSSDHVQPKTPEFISHSLTDNIPSLEPADIALSSSEEESPIVEKKLDDLTDSLLPITQDSLLNETSNDKILSPINTNLVLNAISVDKISSPINIDLALNETSDEKILNPINTDLVFSETSSGDIVSSQISTDVVPESNVPLQINQMICDVSIDNIENYSVQYDQTVNHLESENDVKDSSLAQTNSPIQINQVLKNFESEKISYSSLSVAVEENTNVDKLKEVSADSSVIHDGYTPFVSESDEQKLIEQLNTLNLNKNYQDMDSEMNNLLVTESINYQNNHITSLNDISINFENNLLSSTILNVESDRYFSHVESGNDLLSVGASNQITDSILIETSNSDLSADSNSSQIISKDISTSDQLSEGLNDVAVSLESENCKNLNSSITLEGLSLPLSESKESEQTAVVLPSDQVEECQVEAVAVDLQTIPVGVPEAEGVTEDVDSDSEKDGGWSYMKGNTVGGIKDKSISNKSAAKSDKSDGESAKLTNDSKSKIKSVGNVDKSKKTLPDKKLTDLKIKGVKQFLPTARTAADKLKVSSIDKSKATTSDKSKATMSDKSKATMSDKTKATMSDKPKVASTVGLKREISAPKSCTLTASKISKSTTATRNVVTQSNTRSTTTSTVQSSTKSTAMQSTIRSKITTTTQSSSRSATAQKKPGSMLSSNRNQVSEKSTSSTLKPKTNSNIQTSSATSISKRPLLSNPSNKLSSARTTATRPAVSTLPNRASPAAKPVGLQKPSTVDLKSKPASSTLKRMIPSAAKTTDVKETKDIANKQTLEKKNTLSRVNRGLSSSATSTLKPPVGNKLAAKPRSASSKSETLKKDVPKVPISKLPSKNNTLSKAVKDATKVTTKNNAPPKKELPPGDILAVDENKKNDSESTPSSEEEKFLREVNDKDTSVKELIDVSANVVEEKPTENGCAPEDDIKILEEKNATRPIESLL